jgi:hypothetical protein
MSQTLLFFFVYLQFKFIWYNIELLTMVFLAFIVLIYFSYFLKKIILNFFCNSPRVHRLIRGLTRTELGLIYLKLVYIYWRACSPRLIRRFMRGGLNGTGQPSYPALISTRHALTYFCMHIIFVINHLISWFHTISNCWISVMQSLCPILASQLWHCKFYWYIDNDKQIFFNRFCFF